MSSQNKNRKPNTLKNLKKVKKTSQRNLLFEYFIFKKIRNQCRLVKAVSL